MVAPKSTADRAAPIKFAFATTLCVFGASCALSVFALRSAALRHLLADLSGAGLLLGSLSAPTFVLASFLAYAWYRMRHLEAKEAAALQAAGLDPLSGLPNRLSFSRALDEALARCAPDSPVALIAIDIDRFKAINDTHGHQAGDRLIAGVAERLRHVLGTRGFLARIGGDEFHLLLGDAEMRQCSTLARRIQEAMLTPFDIGRAQVTATLSLGVAFCPQDGDSSVTLVEAADLALYRAKEEGRNRFAFFDKTMENQLCLGMTIADDLREAIATDQLSLLYQPLISQDRRMIGVEALVRWNHPRFGSMSPEDFIPIAESRGLIGPLGEWVLNRACQDARRWPALRMAVNVSPVQFRQSDFLAGIKRIIAANGIDPTRLDLELTEGVLIQDADQAEHLIIELRNLGARMGLDDFGSGYSSMIYLRRFAFDKIKIDKAFLESMETVGEGAIILESIISLGHALGLSVTAEGVETKEHVEFLTKLGCDEMQGFYFAPPLTADEIDARLSLDLWSAARPPADLTIADSRKRNAA
jgi:diguanylate cyclase (GGDEF)-like protein